MKLSQWMWLGGLLAGVLVAGCAGPMVQISCRFDPNTPLTYEFTSSREIEIQWGASSASGDPNQSSTISESLVYTVTYQPEQTHVEGLTRLHATCSQARARRSNSVGIRRARRPDAAEGLAGQSFDLIVDRRGRLVDASGLEDLLKTLAQDAFRDGPGGSRVKDPEMIYDIVATQGLLWDVAGSKESGWLRPGGTWSSQQLVPTPMVKRLGRDITYHLESREGNGAEIVSTSSLSPDKLSQDWPVLYSGTFQVAGTFGFLRGYQVQGLQGEGVDRLDWETGNLFYSDHRFQWEATANPLPLTTIEANPKLIITQSLKIELL